MSKFKIIKLEQLQKNKRSIKIKNKITQTLTFCTLIMKFNDKI